MISDQGRVDWINCCTNTMKCRYFTFITECASPKACTILLRGASKVRTSVYHIGPWLLNLGKDALNEIERNLQDALCVARNIIVDPRIVPGGGIVLHLSQT